jgi:hypothetical protein
MIRLLFVPIIALVLFSCDDSPKEIDPLFYQMSEADSVRCMDEILEEILMVDQGKQKIEDELYNSCISYCGVIDVFRIMINSSGDLMIDSELNSEDVSEKTYQYFMHNRNLTSRETASFSMDPSYSGFEYPFYNRFSLDEVEQKIKEISEETEELRKVEGVDPLLIEYYVSKVNEWKVRKSTLKLIGSESLPEVSFTAHVRFGFQEKSDKYRKVLKEIAFAFYQMRNYECLRYFGETYLNLYDRAQREKRKIDNEMLAALEVLHPGSIYCDDWSKPRPFEQTSPPGPAP